MNKESANTRKADVADLYCKLWFGLLIGASTVLIFQITQDMAIVELPGTDREGKQHGTETILPMNERYVDYEAASASAHTGEKVV